MDGRDFLFRKTLLSIAIRSDQHSNRYREIVSSGFWTGCFFCPLDIFASIIKIVSNPLIGSLTKISAFFLIVHMNTYVHVDGWEAGKASDRAKRAGKKLKSSNYFPFIGALFFNLFCCPITGSLHKQNFVLGS